MVVVVFVAAHVTREYVFRLFERSPPALFLSACSPFGRALRGQRETGSLSFSSQLGSVFVAVAEHSANARKRAVGGLALGGLAFSLLRRIPRTTYFHRAGKKTITLCYALP